MDRSIAMTRVIAATIAIVGLVLSWLFGTELFIAEYSGAGPEQSSEDRLFLITLLVLFLGTTMVSILIAIRGGKKVTGGD